MTTKSEIQYWFENSYVDNPTHMAVFMDSFDYEDYPMYVIAENEKDARQKIYANEDRLMEVYSYALPIEDQLNVFRAFNYTMKED